MSIVHAFDPSPGSAGRDAPLHGVRVRCGTNLLIDTFQRWIVRGLVVGCLLAASRPSGAEQQYTIGGEVQAMDCDNPPASGVAVKWLQNDMPLGRAGVPAGALILTYGDRRVIGSQDLVDAIQWHRDTPVRVKVLLPLTPGAKARETKTFLVTAVPKNIPDVPPGIPRQPRVFMFCVVGPRAQPDRKDYMKAKAAAESICHSIQTDPVNQRATVRIFEFAKPLAEYLQAGGLQKSLATECRVFCNEATENDAVLVYFCGHGGYDLTNNPKALGHFVELGTGFPAGGKDIRRSELFEMIPRRVRLRALITDSCFSEATIDTGKGHFEERSEQWTQEYPSTWQKLLLYSSGSVSLNGCSKDENAFHDPYEDQMIFTGSLVAGSSHHAADWPAFIQSVRDHSSRQFQELKRRHPAEIGRQMNQTPQIIPDQHSVTTMAVASKGEITREITRKIWMKDEYLEER